MVHKWPKTSDVIYGDQTQNPDEKEIIFKEKANSYRSILILNKNLSDRSKPTASFIRICRCLILKSRLSEKHTKFEKNLPHGFDKSADLLSKRQNHEEEYFK